LGSLAREIDRPEARFLKWENLEDRGCLVRFGLTITDILHVQKRFLGFDAVAVNRLDLAAGLDNLKFLQSKSTFPWISANLIDITTKETLFQPYTIRTINNLRIGIIGLTAPGSNGTFPDNDRAEIIPWQQALPPCIKELSSKTDMIILLSNYDQKNNRQIAKIMNEINIIIQSGSGSSNREPLVG